MTSTDELVREHQACPLQNDSQSWTVPISKVQTRRLLVSQTLDLARTSSLKFFIANVQHYVTEATESKRKIPPALSRGFMILHTVAVMIGCWSLKSYALRSQLPFSDAMMFCARLRCEGQTQR